MTCLNFFFSSLLSNDIILLQFLYKHLEYLFFPLMKVRIVKFIPHKPHSIDGPKFSKFSFYETFYIMIGHLVFVTFIHFIYINT
jgi:hypothetical protein